MLFTALFFKKLIRKYFRVFLTTLVVNTDIRAHLNRQRYRAVQQQRLESAVVLQRGTWFFFFPSCGVFAAMLSVLSSVQ